jgi:phosphatidylinositol glycan class V
LSGFAKWDALFFLQIAHEGYLYEKNSAFFPVFPLLIRGVGEILSKLFWVLSKDEAYLIAGVLISFIAFIASVRILEKLTNLIFKDGLFSKSVCIMFSLSPASIFLSAM